MTIERTIAEELHALDNLDHDRLLAILMKLPVPGKVPSGTDLSHYKQWYKERALLDELFSVMERFWDEEDFGLWSTVAMAIELFSEERIITGCIASLYRQPMWKTVELAGQYCSKDQIQQFLRHFQSLANDERVRRTDLMKETISTLETFI